MKTGNKVMAYLRASKATQDIDSQKLGILDYCQKNGLTVSEYMEVELSSRRSEKDRRIDELKGKLNSGDTLICSELSRLGRSTIEVLTLINALLQAGIRIVVLKQGM